MSRYFLGIDTGGTKSHALITDEQGHAHGFSEGGPGNPNGIGHDAFGKLVAEISREAINQAQVTTEQISGMALGVGGYDWDSERAGMLRTLEPMGLKAPIEIYNDAALGIPAGTSEGWGIAVVSGSGSNCRGWNRERTRFGRVSGYGVMMDEGAGAAEMRVKIVQAVSLEWSRRGPATRLTQALIELVHAHGLDDLIEGLCTNRYRLRNIQVPLVFKLAAEGDAVARDLVEWAGRELGSLVLGVVRQLDFQALAFEVVMVGSFFNGSPALAERMRETIHTVAPRARLVRLEAPPVVGAVMLAMESAGLNPISLRASMIRTTQNLLERHTVNRPA